ncbi:MAG: hypothetical protein HYZ58_10895 [Acidobacteria bacterium]|nr:hypothetical protein [Acidobacteriota bacterium]
MQKFHLDEHIQQASAYVVIEAPEPSRLRERQPQARHLEKLPFDTRKLAGDIDGNTTWINRGGRHRGSPHGGPHDPRKGHEREHLKHENHDEARPENSPLEAGIRFAVVNVRQRQVTKEDRKK